MMKSIRNFMDDLTELEYTKPQFWRRLVFKVACGTEDESLNVNEHITVSRCFMTYLPSAHGLSSSDSGPSRISLLLINIKIVPRRKHSQSSFALASDSSVSLSITFRSEPSISTFTAELYLMAFRNSSLSSLGGSYISSSRLKRASLMNRELRWVMQSRIFKALWTSTRTWRRIMYLRMEPLMPLLLKGQLSLMSSA